jgi:4-hydroxy-tetrahydrodipicolinate synthase
MNQPWRGIFAILATLFTTSYQLDEANLRREVRFCFKAGVHGLVGPANASEFTTLSDDERRRWIEIVVAEAGGRVPVIAVITAGHALPAAALSRVAQQAGADGIMAMPPHVLPPMPGLLRRLPRAGRGGGYSGLRSELHRPDRHADARRPAGAHVPRAPRRPYIWVSRRA